jgi:oxazoline/thiazoline synthase
MAVHTGGKKPRAARAGLVAADRNKSSPQFNSKVVLQFAPNFSVYMLPPDVVCLYSEDRKFFLHGELYCAVTEAIAAGKNFGQVVRGLGKKYPSDQVNEALTRIIERRYVVPKPRSPAGVAASYWASLGLMPETAEENLRKCRVRIQSIDVKGAKELGAALSELGLRIVKGAADLTVVVVNDYLEGQLAKLNQQHLSDHKRWLLVQPSGIFPLVGPVFTPGESACWNCLADRMKRNREIKALLDRRKARRIMASPLAQDTLGQSAIALAAVEIAKAIATDFRTDLRNHIVSLDLLGLSIVKHYVATRPQCSACGSKKLRDPGRAPVPIALAAGRKLIITSGGYRSISSRATVARFKKHVSLLTGVVSRLERIDVDLPLNTNYYADHNFSGPSETVDELRARRSGGSFGKGSTAEQGEASALMEAIERYSGIYQGDEIRVTRRFTDFSPGEAILPNDVLLLSDAQYQGSQNPPTPHHEMPTPPPFDRSAEMEWSPVWSLRDQCFKYLPTSLLYFFYRGGPSPDQIIHADSNGCAAGNTLEEAIVQGFLELVERDSYAIWWYNRLQRAGVDLGQFDDSYVRDLKIQLAETGRRVWAIDITSDFGIPSFVAMSHARENGRDFVEYGSGAHFDPRIAILRSLTELNQFLSIGLLADRERSGLDDHDGSGPFRLQDHPYLLPSGSAAVRPQFGSELGTDFGASLGAKFGSLDTREQVMTCVAVAKRAGLDFLILDQTRPDIEVPVVRVIVPGMRHFYRRFAPGRLYDVPTKLGLLDQPVAEKDLNPLHPHT